LTSSQKLTGAAKFRKPFASLSGNQRRKPIAVAYDEATKQKKSPVVVSDDDDFVD